MKMCEIWVRLGFYMHFLFTVWLEMTVFTVISNVILIISSQNFFSDFSPIFF